MIRFNKKAYKIKTSHIKEDILNCLNMDIICFQLFSFLQMIMLNPKYLSPLNYFKKKKNQ